MPSSIADFSRRARLTEKMDGPCSRDQLRACLRDIAWVNRTLFAYRPLLAWLKAVFPASPRPSIHILDVGSGYGDTLRRIERWSHARRLSVELTGLDINPHAVAVAANATPPASRIQWVASDVFAYTPSRPVHFIVSSIFTHHLADNDVIRFLAWMEQHALLGWFINDLSRAPVPYHLFRAFARLMRLHPFVQHDGPVSIARSFVPGDWKKLCAAANLTERDVSIRAFKPGRLCVARTKPQ